LWNAAPCTPIEICTSEEFCAIMKMEAIGPPKRGYISTTLYGVTQQQKGNFHNFQLRYPRCVVFIHLAVCLTTGPKPLPKQAIHIVRSKASSFKCEYPLLSLRSSSSFLCLLPRLLVTSIHLLSFLQ